MKELAIVNRGLAGLISERSRGEETGLLGAVACAISFTRHADEIVPGHFIYYEKGTLLMS